MILYCLVNTMLIRRVVAVNGAFSVIIAVGSQEHLKRGTGSVKISGPAKQHFLKERF